MTRRSRGWAGQCIVSAALALLGCDSAPSPSELAPPAVRRAIEPAEGAYTAALPRVQIGTETRLVVGARPRSVLRWQQPLTLDGDVLVTAPLPASMADGRALLVDAWLSVEDAAFQQAELGELGELVAARELIRAEPTILTGELPAQVEARITLPDPEATRGRTGLMHLVARPLGEKAVDRWEMPGFEVAEGDRLVFGFGVEEEGWRPGWPPVLFRVTATRAGGEPRVLYERRVDPADDVRDRRWFDASLDVSALAGAQTRFSFSAEALGPIGDSALARSFPVISSPELVAGRIGDPPASPAMERPNLILISLDTLRAKSVSAYASPRNTMPMLDSRLAAAGALVRTAVTPFPYTPPSHMSMLTGLDVCAHGVEDRHGVLAPDVLTLAESLRASGYRTAAFTENGYVVAGAGFARGFDSYFELLSEERASPGFASETFDRAARFLEDVDTRPFFLFVHTYQVHGPYTPPRGFQTLFDDGPLPGYDEENGRSLDDYEREIRYTDELLGSFLDALDARGLAERSIVVVTSDHGEEFGEHFFTGHGFDVYDEALLVPMVLRAPGLIAPGRVVEPQVGLMDLPPTLLDLMGLPPLADIQGQSFAGLLRDAPQGGRAPFAERPLVSKASHSRSLRTRAYKFIEGTAKSRWQKLYALGPDPDEKQNVAAGHPDWIAEAEASMAAHEAACQAWRERHPSSGAGSGEAHERPGWMINRDEIERKLRSLGYVE